MTPPRYDIRHGRQGWTVYDTESRFAAVDDGAALMGLSREAAGEAAEKLNQDDATADAGKAS